MLNRLNHIAIVVPDLDASARFYRDALHATVSEALDVPDHGVRVVFVEIGSAKIELLHPLDENSPVANFLARNPAGGLHHLCCEVDDVSEASASLRESGIRVLGGGGAKIGAHGKKVVFLHPKDTDGVLLELEES